MDDLTRFAEQKRQEFTRKLGLSFRSRRRVADLQAQFARLCHARYPSLKIVWQQKDIGPLRILLGNYTPDRLIELITAYLNNLIYHDRTGISFASFYAQHAKIAYDLAMAKQKAEAVATRKQIAEAPEVKPDEVEQFKASGFFKRLPKIFQEKLHGKK